MTVATELLSFSSANARIRVRMTDVAGRTRIIVPGTMLSSHEPGRVRSRVCSLDAICVSVAEHAGRIGALRIVARRAALNITLGELRMQSSTASYPRRCEAGLAVRLRHKLILIDIPAGIVAFGTEGLLVMACLTIGLLALRCESVDELEVKIMNLREVRALAAVDRCQAR